MYVKTRPQPQQEMSWPAEMTSDSFAKSQRSGNEDGAWVGGGKMREATRMAQDAGSNAPTLIAAAP